MGNPILMSHTRPAGQERKPPFKIRLPLLVLVLVVLYIQFLVLPQFIHNESPNHSRLVQFHQSRLEAGLQRCAEIQKSPVQYEDAAKLKRTNSRWNDSTGQNQTIILKNATLFDGEEILGRRMNIIFAKGIITNVLPVIDSSNAFADAIVVEMDGKFVTPGLVDMHSHHLVGAWPGLEATEDTNEMNEAYGPLTPFVRSLDGIKPYDEATTIIRSGGITTSLILPGSANVMGGEAFIVKNVLRAGKNSEESVEEMLLEHGVPKSDRRRYMKMACGENPRRVYKHTRMGNAWVFRKHMERAVELKTKQDSWCLAAASAQETGDAATVASLAEKGLPEELELDSSVAMLRGQVGVNIHCYEPEDFEDMMLHSKEFGFRIQAFHHALSAWKVPELIKSSGDNITIATFSDFGFYKKEAYESNLYAGKILEDSGVPVAYKSDHGEEGTNAKYLLFEAAMAHSFGMSELKALQSITSVPAKSMEQDYRIGYTKVGYDADLVVWDSHPLSIGATPLQVYVDGKATLDPEKVEKSTPRAASLKVSSQQRIRPLLEDEARSKLCGSISRRGAKVVVSGITRSYLGDEQTESSNMTAVIEGGRITCFSPGESCASSIHEDADIININLQNGHLLPGLTAVSQSLGLLEIAGESSTQDGSASARSNFQDPKNLDYAKYGIHIEGKAFKRAQIGGVTRAVTTPLMQGGFAGGVSVGIRIGENKTILDGGIFQSDVGLHFVVGQDAKETDATPTVSMAVAKLRQILTENKSKDNMYGAAANGSIPLVIHTENKYDISQMILLKQSTPSLNLIIFGGAEASAVAKDLAKANISVILTHVRGAPDSWEKKDILVGPPLTRSAASVLVEEGVRFGIAIGSLEGDSHIHSLPLEASWAAKFAGLDDRAAVKLVSSNINEILGLDSPKKTENENEEGKGEWNRDFAIWEGNPLQFGASVVLAFDGDGDGNGGLLSCWPVAT
ncbi:hypothetical protein K402DRAFT_373086 [Aulographum hederae CBS 113979]|uniref:Amidohydrolase-related domain-containing protein n=1 Tax=Aulographum hederae CBS 113979 TaxID=1176131 RepID=A0A6G1H710_9PEZI|nr:hypothetical protein K402DRAFT_373086 [Aulographum hederae CBS 113979]